MTEAKPSDWLGREQRQDAILDPLRCQALQAALDDDQPALQAGQPLPPLWHWLYFWELTPGPDLGRDGHSKRGGFLPPLPLPQRMWAGSRLTFKRPALLGSRVWRRLVTGRYVGIRRH